MGKYNPRKQMQRVAKHLLKDCAVVYCDRLEGCVLYNRKKHYIIKPTALMIDSIGFPHKWSCLIAAFGRNQFDEYFKSEVLVTDNFYRQEKLAPIFEEHHARLIKTIPEKQLCGVGWIADPKGDDISEKEAGKIFENVQAWD